MADNKTIYAWKLVRKRKDGTLGPLFINARQRLRKGVWLRAEDHPTKGFKHRPGWHCVARPIAPHLSEKGRVWVRVKMRGWREQIRPAAQGGLWYIAGSVLIQHREYAPDGTELIAAMLADAANERARQWEKKRPMRKLVSAGTFMAKQPYVS